MQNKDSRRKRAAELLAASNGLTTRQKIAIAQERNKTYVVYDKHVGAVPGKATKELTRLYKKLDQEQAAGHDAIKLGSLPQFASKAEQRRVERAKRP